jgi:hypothetical protein
MPRPGNLRRRARFSGMKYSVVILSDNDLMAGGLSVAIATFMAKS